VEQRRANGVAVDHHGVHHTIYIGQQHALRNQCRVYTQLDALAGVLGNAEVLDAVAKRFRRFHIFGGELADAFGIGLGKLQRNAEGNGCQNGQLVRRIDAFHVEGRVRLGIAERLRFFQHIVKGTALVAHFGEDKVAGAVDDAGYPVDLVGGQAFAQRLEDRDAAGHGGFKGHVDTLGVCRGKNFVAVLGNQRLVGGNDMLAVGNGLQDQFTRRGGATDQLDEDIDFRVSGAGKDVARPYDTIDITRRVVAARADMGKNDLAPDAAGNFSGVALQHIDGTATDGTQPHDSDLDRLAHSGLLQNSRITR